MGIGISYSAAPSAACSTAERTCSGCALREIHHVRPTAHARRRERRERVPRAAAPPRTGTASTTSATATSPCTTCTPRAKRPSATARRSASITASTSQIRAGAPGSFQTSTSAASAQAAPLAPEEPPAHHRHQQHEEDRQQIPARHPGRARRIDAARVEQSVARRQPQRSGELIDIVLPADRREPARTRRDPAVGVEGEASERRLDAELLALGAAGDRLIDADRSRRVRARCRRPSRRAASGAACPRAGRAQSRRRRRSRDTRCAGVSADRRDCLRCRGASRRARARSRRRVGSWAGRASRAESPPASDRSTARRSIRRDAARARGRRTRPRSRPSAHLRAASAAAIAAKASRGAHRRRIVQSPGRSWTRSLPSGSSRAGSGDEIAVACQSSGSATPSSSSRASPGDAQRDERREPRRHAILEAPRDLDLDAILDRSDRRRRRSPPAARARPRHLAAAARCASPASDELDEARSRSGRADRAGSRTRRSVLRSTWIPGPRRNAGHSFELDHRQRACRRPAPARARPDRRRRAGRRRTSRATKTS